MIDKVPFVPASAFFVNRELNGKMRDMFVVYASTKVTCDMVKNNSTDAIAREYAYAMFLTPWKAGTFEISSDSPDPTKVGGEFVFFYINTAEHKNSSGAGPLNSGSLSVNKLTPTSAEITFEAGESLRNVGESRTHYIKGTLPVTRCQ